MSSSRQLQVLDTPTITAAKGEAIIQISPTALRFWEKLGLGPRAGKKDTTAFVLYEEESVEKQSQVESWLATLATSYQVRFFRCFCTLLSYLYGRESTLEY